MFFVFGQQSNAASGDVVQALINRLDDDKFGFHEISEVKRISLQPLEWAISIEVTNLFDWNETKTLDLMTKMAKFLNGTCYFRGTVNRLSDFWSSDQISETFTLINGLPLIIVVENNTPIIQVCFAWIMEFFLRFGIREFKPDSKEFEKNNRLRIVSCSITRLLAIQGDWMFQIIPNITAKPSIVIGAN